jgi:uncharacterized Zn finger protein (UPF0148 family)
VPYVAALAHMLGIFRQLDPQGEIPCPVCKKAKRQKSKQKGKSVG